MMTFNDIKNIIREIFKAWEIEDAENIIKLTYKSIDKLFILTNDDFDKYTEQDKLNHADASLEVFRDDYYEVLLRSDLYMYNFDDEDADNCTDNLNGITYRYSAISDELVFSILCRSENTYMLSELLRFPSSFMLAKINTMFPNKENSIIALFSKLLFRRYYSLKIESKTKISLSKFQSYMYAYVYTFMFNTQTSLFPCFDIKELFPQRHFRRKSKDFDYPKKIYNQELISYYNEAISSTILSHKYLSFYHIIEYFYENIFMEDQIEKAKEIITDVSFSYKRSKDIAKLIKSIQIKSIDKDIAINEKNALCLLIKKHVSQDTLKERLTDRYGEPALDTLNIEVNFSGGNIVIFSKKDEEQYVNSLANRIYKTRNAIVHSKESLTEEKKNKKYKPIRDDQELLLEISLIQVVAEIILNETSKDL